MNGKQLVVSVLVGCLSQGMLGCGPKPKDNPGPALPAPTDDDDNDKADASKPPRPHPSTGAQDEVDAADGSPSHDVDGGGPQPEDGSAPPNDLPDAPGPVIGATSDTPAPALSELVEMPQVKAPWTIMFYGHGDHNLSNSLLRDMREMQAATLGDSVQMLVIADFDSSQLMEGSNLHYPAGLGLYQVFGDNADLVEVAHAPEANLDDPAVLADLVGAVFAAYPSERRGLVLWDHGGGWELGFGSDSQDGTVSNPHPMAIEDAAAAVLAGLKTAGITEKPGLDFFSFDTCLLGGAEPAFAFKDVAKVYIGNAELDYGNGSDYEHTLSYIAAHPDAPINELATHEVSDWDGQHATAGVDDALLRSHVALDLTEIDAFASSIAVLSEALSESLDPIELARSSFFALPPYSSEFASGSDSPGLRDVGQLLEHLADNSSNPSVVNAAEDATAALDRLIVAHSQGELRAGAGQSGLSIEQTLGAQLTQQHLSSYDEHASDWVAASHWDLVLAFAAASADDEPPSFDHSVRNPEPTPEDLPVLEFSSDDPTLAKAEVNLAVHLDDGRYAILGLVGSGVVEGGDSYEFTWEGKVMGFDDGQPAALQVWLDVGSSSENTVYSIPGVVRSGSDEWYAQLVFGASEEVITNLVAWEGDNPSTWSFEEVVQAVPGATFTPIYVGIDGQGESTLEGDPMPVTESGFSLTPQYRDAGDYMFVTTLTDVWGNVGGDVDLFTLEASLEQ